MQKPHETGRFPGNATPTKLNRHIQYGYTDSGKCTRYTRCSVLVYSGMVPYEARMRTNIPVMTNHALLSFYLR